MLIFCGVQFGLRYTGYSLRLWFMAVDLLIHLKKQSSTSWSGYKIKTMTKPNKKFKKEAIGFLSIIEFNLSYKMYVYAALMFAVKNAKQFKIPTPCVTFNQLLWQKAAPNFQGTECAHWMQSWRIPYTDEFPWQTWKSYGSIKDTLEVYSQETLKHMLAVTKER